MEQECSNCGGNGWVSGSQAAHGCNGTDEDCAMTCPVQEQIQIGCDFCGGIGKVTSPTNNS